MNSTWTHEYSRWFRMDIKHCIYIFLLETNIFASAITLPLPLSRQPISTALIFSHPKRRRQACPRASVTIVCRRRPAGEGVTLAQVYFPRLVPCRSGWTTNLIPERLAFMSTKASWNPRNLPEVLQLSMWVFVSSAAATIMCLWQGSKVILAHHSYVANKDDSPTHTHTHSDTLKETQ